MIEKINQYFQIKSILKDTSGVLEASKEYLKKIEDNNQAICNDLMKKYGVNDINEALDLERKQLLKQWEPSVEAVAYIKELNDMYQGKTIKFYYSDPMLYYCTIDDVDCDHIPIYKEVCNSIELIHTDTRVLPMIVTKDKNYSLIDMIDIPIIKSNKKEQ